MPVVGRVAGMELATRTFASRPSRWQRQAHARHRMAWRWDSGGISHGTGKVLSRRHVASTADSLARLRERKAHELCMSCADIRHATCNIRCAK